MAVTSSRCRSRSTRPDPPRPPRRRDVAPSVVRPWSSPGSPAHPGDCLPAHPPSTMKADSRMGTAVDDVRYRLLGPMEVWVAGTPVKLPGIAERALLAQLLLSPGRTIPATMLIDRLW